MGDRMVAEAQAVRKVLGGERVLGPVRKAKSRELHESVRQGLPASVLPALLQASGLTLRTLASALALSPRSLQRRRGGRLDRIESDRLYRLARIVALAADSLGDADRARLWLQQPNRALGGAEPVSLLDTELGARQVENVLGRIAFGGVS